jgi:hypothetical protein
VDDVLDELHAAAASAMPAIGTAQRTLFGIERTALLCPSRWLARLSIVDYRPLDGVSLIRSTVPVDTRFFTIC